MFPNEGSASNLRINIIIYVETPRKIPIMARNIAGSFVRQLAVGSNQRASQHASLFCSRRFAFKVICSCIVSVFVGGGSLRYEQLFLGFLHGRKMSRLGRGILEIKRV